MRPILLLLLLILPVTLLSQPPRLLRHAILIRNNKTHKVFAIKENLRISLITSEGKGIHGTVRRISSDTLFFNESSILIRKIDTIYLAAGMVSAPNPFNKSGKMVLYAAGSPTYQIICPPDSVYRNPWTYKIYYTNILRRIKEEWRETRNPLEDNEIAALPSGSATTDTTPCRQYSSFLKWNISKLAHLEIALAYEQRIGRLFTWETELSAIFGVRTADAYYTIPVPLYNYNGFSVTTYPKYYIINSTTYVSAVAMYRYLWATDIRTDWPEKQENGQLQDQYRNDLGISLRIGIMKRYGVFVVDYYLGGGIKYILLHQLVYGYYLYHDSGQMRWYNEDHSPNIYDKVLLGPVINLGIKIGFAL